MGIRHAAQSQFPLRGLREGPAAPWVRPADWIGLPWIPDADQALVGLIAVNDTTNERLALLCAGAYTVDWGDGTAPENVATGVKAEHLYTFATLSSPVTSRGYKTAVVRVYPQAGQNLTTINLLQKPSGFSSPGAPGSLWLDIQINAAQCTTLVIGGTNPTHLMVERLHIRAHNTTSLYQLCYQMPSLQSLPLFNTSLVTTIYQMCRFCVALTEVPFFDFSSVITATGAFDGCRSLASIHPFNLSSATTIYLLLNECYSLLKMPLMQIAVATDAGSFVAVCAGLREIDALNFSSVTNLTLAFTSAQTLLRIKITGIKVTFTIVNCSLPTAAINELFTNLATVTGQTVTVTGNPGAATCDTSIATAKGWTVVT